MVTSLPPGRQIQAGRELWQRSGRRCGGRIMCAAQTLSGFFERPFAVKSRRLADSRYAVHNIKD
jgi:hypothetical protein